jgi:hypothetical protein
LRLGGCALGLACSLQDFGRLSDGIEVDAGAFGAGAGGNPAFTGGGGGAGGAPGGAAGAGEAAGASALAGASGSAGAGGAGGVGGVGGTGGVGGAGGAPEPLADAGPDTNLVIDPGFETGVSNWGTFGSVLLGWQSQGPYAGSHCLRASSRGDAWAGPLYLLKGMVSPGETYRVTAWLRTPHVDQSVKITTKTLCTGETSSTFADVTSVKLVQNYWQSYSGTFVAPTCPLQDFAVYIEGPPAGEDIYVDEFRVEPGAAP